MKVYQLYPPLFCLLLAGCGSDASRPERIVRHRVIVVRDSVEAPVQKPLTQVSADTSYLEYVFRGYELTNVRDLDSTILVDLRYAGTNNFLKRNFYDGLRRAWFPCEVATRLCNAQYFLKQLFPHYSLVILDAARPLHIQQMMWDGLEMPPDRKFNYLTPPYEISLHNYGCAVDLTIIDHSQNKLIDMGTDFDTFEKLSQPMYEGIFLKSGELSQEAFDNRRLLRFVMKRAGFNSIPSEWWHFGYGSKDMVAAKFKLIK